MFLQYTYIELACQAVPEAQNRLLLPCDDSMLHICMPRCMTKEVDLSLELRTGPSSQCPL